MRCVALIGVASALSARPPLIIFGRPGAGKSTIADALVAHPDAECFGLDLDVCVPQWMRDNFARGIYPTLDERRDFAKDAAARVRDRTADGPPSRCVVSFSFVNEDLRDHFREAFPDATWALVDTSEADAAERIAAREGHFYTGTDEDAVARGDEWTFAPVTFPHTVLDGRRSVADNVRELLPFVS
mmetsp:Transcript_22407/g.67257  ORF Transcript_22407/g.67257 Transcript_22407/m.67257 type:complete len:186 (+) Transcript_22407:802-1359(+)